MPVTNFLQWNPAENNQESDSGYLADTQRVNGAPIGGTTEFPSVTANKLFFQCSTMATALAGFIVAQGLNAQDSNLATLQANLQQAIENAALAALAPVGAYSASGNGYVKIPGTPLIIQWGTTANLSTGSNNTSVSQTFPIAFPNSCFSIVGTSNHSADNVWAPVIVSATALSATAVTFNCDTANPSFGFDVGVAIRWIAIGW